MSNSAHWRERALVAFLHDGDEATLRESLRQIPTDGLTWGRLAALVQRHGRPVEAAGYYRRSLETLRFRPGFMGWRLTLGVALWPSLDEATRRLTAGQAWLMWQSRAQRSEFLRLARLAPLAEPLHRMLADYYPDALPEFEQRWRRPKHLRLISPHQ